ncbi:MAG TPA: hypothetical protein VLD86_13250, partial [Ilumatobacteraceae bacterium]|nr:hypothetical protein [Ilumatobacteraceae bacterium]
MDVIDVLNAEREAIIEAAAHALERSRLQRLEEATWTAVVDAIPPRDLAHAIGLVGTVVGVGRDALARTYVSAASQEHVRSLDFSAL